MTPEIKIFDYYKNLVGVDWGQNDCNTVAIDIMQILIGRPLDIPTVRGEYDSAKTAYEFYADYPITWNEFFENNGKYISKNFAQTGDILIKNHENYIELSVWLQGHTAMIDMEERKLVILKGMPEVDKVWRINRG